MIDAEASTDQLVEAILAKGQDAPQAMSILYHRLHSTVNGTVRQYVRDIHLAEDISQEVWLKVAQKVGLYQPGTQFVAWLKAIAKNTALDHLRKMGRAPEEVLHPDYLQLDRPQPDLDMEEQAESRQLAVAVSEQMSKLKPSQRDCLQLRFFHGRSSGDTALIMGKTEVAVRALTLRSLRRLREILPKGQSSAEMIEALLTIAAGKGRVVGVRVQTTYERAPSHGHVPTR
ncbi:RNA polymerase sigma factor [Streptomyces sp. NPDC056362]|uniref:RNA polymerase sigma factor n=1 Tax=unclassified Streptomyces TaxID=2593676 RepID=UPI0035DD6482